MLELPFSELYKLSISNPEKVWDEFGKEVVWNKPYTSVIEDKESPTPNWFVGGEINMSYNCLDRSIEEGYGDDVAVIYECPGASNIQKITYKQLLESVKLLAGVMVQKCGLKKGDNVLLCYPVIPQCLIGMLACTRIGAIYSVISGGFPTKAISSRIQLTEPKLILTCNISIEPGLVIKYKEKIDIAIDTSKFKPDYCIVYNRPNTEPAKMMKDRDLDWTNEMKIACPQGPIPLKSNHPMFIIYTSGTTGEPKGLVMATGSAVVVDKYQMKYLLNLKPRECWWMLGDFVWITGQTIMSYGPLLSRVTTILYEGKYASKTESEEILKILYRHNVTSFFSSPTILRMMRNNCKEINPNIVSRNLRAIFTAGEPPDSYLQEWIRNSFKCSIYDLWGQTEINSVMTSPGLAFGRSTGSKSIFMLGFQPKIVDIESGKECPFGKEGKLLLKLPMYPAIATTLYKNHDRYLKTYYSKHPGFYDTMDLAMIMEDGSFKILSRSDDIIQVSSIRICGGAVEEVCLLHGDIVSAAVVPMDDPIYGQVPFGFFIKRDGSILTDKEIIGKVFDLVKEHIGEFTMFQHAVMVPDLPRTNTNKVSKYLLAAMVNGKEYVVHPTIGNPHIYSVIYDILVKKGYGATLPNNE